MMSRRRPGPRSRPPFAARVEGLEGRRLPAASIYLPGSVPEYLHQNFADRSATPADVVFFGDSLTSWFGEGGSTQSPWLLPGPEQFVPHATGEDLTAYSPNIWQEQIARFRAFNFGIPGDSAEALLWRVENGELVNPPGPLPAGQPTPTLTPKVVVLLVGINDLIGSSPADLASGAAATHTYAAIKAVIDEIHAQSPTTRVLDMDLLPTGVQAYLGPIQQVNARLNDLPGAAGYGYLQTLDLTKALADPNGDGLANPTLYYPDVRFDPDFSEANIHLNPAGYEIWASALQAPLEHLLGQAAQPPGGVGAELGVFDRKTATYVVDQTSPLGQVVRRLANPTQDTVGALAQQFGNPADANVSVVGDYDGDGLPDFGVYDRTTATFLIARTDGQPSLVAPLGDPTHANIPIVGDYDGDGRADLAVYDATAAVFLVEPSGGGPLLTWSLGDPAHQDIPIAVDYAGTGRTQLALFDRTTSTFIVVPPGGGAPAVLQLGDPSHHTLPLAGDYDGDGRTDYGIYDPTSATFLVIPSGGGAPIIRHLGDPTHANVPITGDYDGDGRTDFAVYDRTTSTLLVDPSGGGTEIVRQFGDPAEPIIPLSAPLIAEVLDPSASPPGSRSRSILRPA